MAIYPNVLREYLLDIERNIKFDEVIDHLIAEKFIDGQKYYEIWSQNSNKRKLRHLLEIVLKDGHCCKYFVKILTDIQGFQHIAYAITKDIDNIRKVIVLGGFPQFSYNYVVRNSVADDVKEETLKLQFGINYILVVYGFTGFGKSCLVNQVIQTKSIIESTSGAMFWIHLGEHQDTTNVINPLWNLYNDAVNITNKQPLVYRPEDLSTLKSHVKRLFLDEKLKDALIILDDVKCGKVFDAFDFGCKLIVTTQDKNIVKDSRAKFIKIKTGFAMKESFELLRKSLNTHDLSCKKEKIEQIHDLCEGCPMLLNIMGTILKESREEALSTVDFWDSIIEEIKDNNNLVDPAIKSGIQKIVDRLDPMEKEYFYSLAVFPKHVNIRREILMKLWNKSTFQIRQLMTHLEDKCLVVSFYHDDLQTYVYSIHSLVRSYLMEKAQIDITKYHKKMISIYDSIRKNPNPQTDPCVRYIFSYFAYHSKHAEEKVRFTNYFDLEFIENKIKYVSSTDLIADYDTYRQDITEGDPFDGEKLEQFKEFVTSYSTHLHTSPEANIIQFALSYGNRLVFQEAKKYASRNADQLYFTVDRYSGRHMHFPRLQAVNDVTAVAFLDAEEILLGMRDGTIEIKLFNHYQSNLRLFQSHRREVCKLVLNANKSRFISISHDNTAKLWNINQDLDPQSPVCKQHNWKNVHSPDEKINRNINFAMDESNKVISAAFPFDNTEEAVTASDFGQIIRWNTRTGNRILASPHRGLPINCISYSHDSKKLIFTYNNNIHVFTRTLNYNGMFGDNEFKQIHLSKDSTKILIALTDTKLELWDYLEKNLVYNSTFPSRIILSTIENNYLLLAIREAICLFHLGTHRLTTVQNDHGIPAALHLLPESVAFITVENSEIRRCEISLKPNEHPIISNMELLCCHWNDSVPIYAAVTDDIKIDLFSGSISILSGIEVNEKITCLCFSTDGNCLLIGTQSGNLFYYTYKTKSKRSIVIHTEPIEKIKCFGEKIVIVSAADSLFILGERNRSIPIETKLIDFYYIEGFLVYFTENARVVLLNLQTEQMESCQLDFTPIKTAVHIFNHLIAIVYPHGLNYKVEILKLLLPIQSIHHFLSYEIKSLPNSIAFSHNGNILAVGCENGGIEVFSVSEKVQGREELILDEKPVESMIFAQSPQSVLASIGEQVAWWNLTSFERDFSEPLNCQLSSLSLLQNKRTDNGVPYLLANMNVDGKQLKFISASHDFKAFLIVDRDGNIFKMEFCQ